MSTPFVFIFLIAICIPTAIRALQCRCTPANWFLQNRVPCSNGICSIENSNCVGTGLPNAACFWEKVQGGGINRIEYTCGCTTADKVRVGLRSFLS